MTTLAAIAARAAATRQSRQAQLRSPTLRVRVCDGSQPIVPNPADVRTYDRRRIHLIVRQGAQTRVI